MVPRPELPSRAGCATSVGEATPRHAHAGLTATPVMAASASFRFPRRACRRKARRFWAGVSTCTTATPTALEARAVSWESLPEVPSGDLLRHHLPALCRDQGIRTPINPVLSRAPLPIGLDPLTCGEPIRRRAVLPIAHPTEVVVLRGARWPVHHSAVKEVQTLDSRLAAWRRCRLTPITARAVAWTAWGSNPYFVRFRLARALPYTGRPIQLSSRDCRCHVALALRRGGYFYRQSSPRARTASVITWGSRDSNPDCRDSFRDVTAWAYWLGLALQSGFRADPSIPLVQLWSDPGGLVAFARSHNPVVSRIRSPGPAPGACAVVRNPAPPPGPRHLSIPRLRTANGRRGPSAVELCLWCSWVRRPRPKWVPQDLNLRPPRCERGALPSELGTLDRRALAPPPRLDGGPSGVLSQPGEAETFTPWLAEQGEH